MGKLKAWLKKIFRGSSSQGSSSPAPANPNKREIERQIDEVVKSFILDVQPPALCAFGSFRKVSCVEYWQSVVKAICFAESNFNPRERFFEDSMGYYSEGLMQLSYEDCLRYGFYLDKSKNEIFDIEKNIQFGMIILNRIVRKHGHFIFNSGNYWAVLQPKNKRHQVFLNKFNEYQRGDS